MVFGAPAHQRPHFDGFTLTMRCQRIRFASAPFTSFQLAKCGGVPFAACKDWEQSRIQNLRMVGDNTGPILSCLWTKVHKVFSRCRRSLYFPTPLPNYLRHISFRRCSLLRLKVIEKPNECKGFFGPQFFERDDTNFSTVDCSHDWQSTIWQSLVKFCLLSPPAKPGNELECRIYRG